MESILYLLSRGIALVLGIRLLGQDRVWLSRWIPPRGLLLVRLAIIFLISALWRATALIGRTG